jgi:DNA replication initiation complex subunit (GINS family)
MPRTAQKADRELLADPVHDGEAAELRDLLKESKVASMLDEIVRRRVGHMIGRAAVDSAKPRR